MTCLTHLTRFVLLCAVSVLVVLVVRFEMLDLPLGRAPRTSPVEADVLPTVTRMPVYDDAFLESLLRDPDLDRMARRAEEAGLVVHRSGSDTETFYQIIDPASDTVLVSGSIIYERFGPRPSAPRVQPVPPLPSALFHIVKPNRDLRLDWAVWLSMAEQPVWDHLEHRAIVHRSLGEFVVEAASNS